MDCCYEPNSDGIPIDLFVSKNKRKGGGSGIKFTDSSSNLVFSVDPRLTDRLLYDSSGNPHISITHNQVRTGYISFFLEFQLLNKKRGY